MSRLNEEHSCSEIITITFLIHCSYEHSTLVHHFICIDCLVRQCRLQQRYSQHEKKYAEANMRLTEEYKRITEHFKDLQAKFSHFQQADLNKYQAVRPHLLHAVIPSHQSMRWHFVSICGSVVAAAGPTFKHAPWSLTLIGTQCGLDVFLFHIGPLPLTLSPPECLPTLSPLLLVCPHPLFALLHVFPSF